jgi:hypothetical protein
MTKKDLQKVASAISGYEGVDSHASARDDFYYDLTSESDKLEQIYLYAQNVYSMILSEVECKRIFEFLEGDYNGSHEHWLAFKKLEDPEKKDWKRLSICVPQKDYHKLQLLATTRKQSVSAFIRYLLDIHIKANSSLIPLIEMLVEKGKLDSTTAKPS